MFGKNGRLIAQLLTETLLLFVVAGVAALPLTMWLMNGLLGFLPALPAEVNLDLSINPRVVAFALGTALVTAVLFGLAPAKQALGTDLAASLHGAYATVDRRRFRLRNALVVAQVALSLMLVVTASLFVRTLQNVAHTDPGYAFANVELVSIDATISGYPSEEAVGLVDRLQERLRAVDGVTGVSTARMIPLQGSSLGLGDIQVAGYQNARGDTEVDADWNVVSPGYFGSVGVIGIFLAALGLYGLMAFLVTQRTREIAIRMALGASAGNMRSMVMKQAAWLGTIGGVIGLVLAGVIGTLAQSLLVGVPAIDPLAFGGTAALFAVILTAACWTPARRAAATDPAMALRAE